MNSGCICCSLVGDFGEALKEVLTKYSPDRVIIEPSGVGKLSDVVKAVKNIGDEVTDQQYGNGCRCIEMQDVYEELTVSSTTTRSNTQEQ